jgi:hypothetical protein
MTGRFRQIRETLENSFLIPDQTSIQHRLPLSELTGLSIQQRKSQALVTLEN